MSEEIKSQWVKEITADQFEVEVMERSQKCPVIVDFWAPWCGPCRQLGPLLEKIVDEQQGKVFLVKVNTEEQPDLAATFGVQSIPMVAAISYGQFVDRFEGLLPEETLREWVQKLLPSEIEELLLEGKELEEADPAAAEEKYRRALEIEPKNDAIKIRLAAVLLAQGDHDQVQAILTELEQRGFLEPEAEQIKSQLELEQAGAEAGGVDDARTAAEADPENLDLQLKLADALAVSRKYEEAFEICLSVVQKDRDGHGESARETMVTIFKTLGNENPLVGEYRRKLATLLY